MLDLNCVGRPLVLLGDCCTPTTFVAFSCIRSFRALLWVTVFAMMISAIVMIWLCLEGDHGIRIVGKGIYNFVCIHLKHFDECVFAAIVKI